MTTTATQPDLFTLRRQRTPVDDFYESEAGRQYTDLFEAIVLARVAIGVRVSGKSINEDLRRDGHGINNTWVADYTRRFVEEHPALAQHFEFRGRQPALKKEV